MANKEYGTNDHLNSISWQLKCINESLERIADSLEKNTVANQRPHMQKFLQSLKENT